LLRQRKSNQKEGDPSLPPLRVPCVARLVRRLRNSRYALRQSSPTSSDRFAPLGGAQGMKSEPQNRFWHQVQRTSLRGARRRGNPDAFIHKGIFD
jgi:hypothetical protein